MNRIVVDTAVFWNRQAMQVLMESPLEIIVPSIVLAERVRQISARGQDVPRFLERLDLTDWTVEALGRDEALRYAPRLTDQEHWRRHARDALIAGHVRDGDVLWTGNQKDFLALGLPRDQIQRV